ncbi:MAG: YciI family protein [Hyphomonadaceae bacterium]
MRYLLLIHADEAGWNALSPEQMSEAMGAYFAYSEALAKSGKLVSADELQPNDTAKCVRVRDGKTGVVDGPFADTKETVGGYYLIEAETEAEALDWAAKCPGAHHGVIEVRPVVVR